MSGKLKWDKIGVLYYAFEQNKIGYCISEHAKYENKTGFGLRIYRIETSVPTLFHRSEIPDLPSAKAIAETWRAENKAIIP